MTTDERIEDLERGLASARRLNRRLPTSAAVCLGLIFTWVFFAQPGPLGTAQASGPANPYEAENTKLQADFNLLKRENERLRKELDEAKKDKSPAAPTDAQGPSTPQPVATQPPSPDEPPATVRIPGLPETDSTWWREPAALAKHMNLRVSMSATNPQASVWMWLQRHNYFAEQRVLWKVDLALIMDSHVSLYHDKDSASIEYYKCLGEAEKFSKEAEKFSKDKIPSGVKKDEAVANEARAARNEALAAQFRGEAKAWKILMNAGGGLSLCGTTRSPEAREKDIIRSISELKVHIVLPGEKSVEAYYVGKHVVLIQGRIVALGTNEAVLTGKASRASVD